MLTLSEIFNWASSKFRLSHSLFSLTFLVISGTTIEVLLRPLVKVTRTHFLNPILYQCAFQLQVGMHSRRSKMAN